MAAIVGVPPMPTPATDWPTTSPAVLSTQMSVAAVAAASVVAMAALEFASCATSWP